MGSGKDKGIGTTISTSHPNLPTYQCTICIYMYKHTDGTLRKTLANLVRWYVTKKHPK